MVVARKRAVQAAGEETLGRAKRKQRHEPEANSSIPGLDDKAIESKIGALVREGAQ